MLRFNRQILNCLIQCETDHLIQFDREVRLPFSHGLLRVFIEGHVVHATGTTKLPSWLVFVPVCVYIELKKRRMDG